MKSTENLKILIYDCEIIKCIPDLRKVNLGHLEYCKGWDDYQNMGISVIGAAINTQAWGSSKDTWHYIANTDFYPDIDKIEKFNPLEVFQEGLDKTDVLVGFNNQSFDDNLIKANGFTITEDIINYDILAEIWEGAGLPRQFEYLISAGFSLGAICEANGLGSKSGDGANAAVLWQEGKETEVIEYCMNDIDLTRKLFELIQEEGEIVDPRQFNEKIKYYNPDKDYTKPIKVKTLQQILNKREIKND